MVDKIKFSYLKFTRPWPKCIYEPIYNEIINLKKKYHISDITDNNDTECMIFKLENLIISLDSRYPNIPPDVKVAVNNKNKITYINIDTFSKNLLIFLKLKFTIPNNAYFSYKSILNKLSNKENYVSSKAKISFYVDNIKYFQYRTNSLENIYKDYGKLIEISSIIYKLFLLEKIFYNLSITYPNYLSELIFNYII